jgi:hypothetical protein
MKLFLRLSLSLMILAGLYGSVDMLMDVQNARFINYEHDTALNTLRKKAGTPVSFVSNKKAQPLSSLNSPMMLAASGEAAKKPRKKMRLEDLGVESFSRGDIRFEPELELVVLDSAANDSIQKADKQTLKTAMAQTRKDSLR